MTIPRGRTARYAHTWTARNEISYEITIYRVDRIKGRGH